MSSLHTELSCVHNACGMPVMSPWSPFSPPLPLPFPMADFGPNRSAKSKRAHRSQLPTAPAISIPRANHPQTLRTANACQMIQAILSGPGYRQSSAFWSCHGQNWMGRVRTSLDHLTLLGHRSARLATHVVHVTWHLLPAGVSGPFFLFTFVRQTEKDWNHKRGAVQLLLCSSHTVILLTQHCFY